ncbi:acyl-ACP desaturase [Streptomyces sp. NPDC003011]
MNSSTHGAAAGGPHWIEEMEPVVARLLDRHLKVAKEWFPHQYIPWGAGADFDGPLDGTPWQDAQSALDPLARSALVLSLLTEDNLPTYHHELATIVGRDGAWGNWLHRWTAEEDRHSIALRSYVHATRAVDPVALERARMVHMSTPMPGFFPRGVRGIAYVLVQELATRVAHRSTGLHTAEPVCAQLFSRIAADENLHMVFYRDLYEQIFDLLPDKAMEGLRWAVCDYRMPGQPIPGFAAMSLSLAMAGWYDPRMFLDSVLAPIMRALRVMDRTDLSPAGEVHRAALADHLELLRVRAGRFEERRQDHRTAGAGEPATTG